MSCTTPWPKGWLIYDITVLYTHRKKLLQYAGLPGGYVTIQIFFGNGKNTIVLLGVSSHSSRESAHSV